jgi:hypothetical protein
MNGTHILDHYRDQLAEEIGRRGGDIPPLEPLDISPWLAMSLMQKAIRRGRVDLALGAAATLLRGSPERLWRRICVTAYEDIGVADFDTVAVVTSALKGKRWRATLGGEWAVASYLVGRMCRSVKCRATDDLAYVCDWHPAYERTRLDLTFRPIPDLLERIAGPGPLPERALALWFAVGTDRYQSPVLRERRGEPHSVLDALCEAGFPDCAVEVCREGLRKSGGLLAALLILLMRETRPSDRHAEPDDLPGEKFIDGVPCWAYDMHVREGNRAMASFMETRCETARWIQDRLPANRRNRFLGGMLFRVESGLVDRRLRWETGDRLRRMSDLEARGLDPQEMAEGYVLLRKDLPVLNDARHLVTGSGA